MNRLTRAMVLLVLCGIGVFLAGFVIRSTSSAFGTGNVTPAFPSPLTNASEAQVGQVALDLVRQDFDIRSGTPQIVLTRSIVRDDLPKLNLPSIPRPTIEEPPLMLVIIKGDFGSLHLPSIVTGQTDQVFKYIGYIFDLWAGAPTLTLADPDGGEFRTALNDPTLPIAPTPIAPLPVDSPAPLQHYGDVAPTVAPPNQ
jgi:hypothetical protein